MHAIGRLQHHFWGDYHATIVLAFDTPAQAQQALALPDFTDWRAHAREPRALVYHGTGQPLKAVERQLVALGADKAKLTSLAKSIDFGEPFHIHVIPSDGTEQQGLF